MVDLVHELEIVVGLEAMFGHQSAHRRAIALVVVLLHPERLFLGHFEEVGDVGADALVDLLPEIEVMRIECVVEVEDPCLDVAEAARRGRVGHNQGSLKRMMADGCVERSMTAKPAEFKPRATQSFWLEISKRLSRVHSATWPPQASAASPRLTVRPSASTAS